MYSTQELIIKSAQRALLNNLFTETMSDLPQKIITIHDASQTNLTDILNQLEENEVLVTNDEYVIEKCDFQVINKQGRILLTVSEDGSTINDLDQVDYIDESTCELLSKIYDTIKHCDSICIVTDEAA